MNASQEARGLRALIERLAKFRIIRWGSLSSNAMDRDPGEREIEDDTANAHVVSSRMLGGDRHQVVLDIDHPAWLVRSSTPGHYHLYIDVPEGIKWEDYVAMMLAMASAGVVEQGFVGASIERGYSCVRLPGVKKDTAGVPREIPWVPPAQIDTHRIRKGVERAARAAREFSEKVRQIYPMVEAWDPVYDQNPISAVSNEVKKSLMASLHQGDYNPTLKGTFVTGDTNSGINLGPIAVTPERLKSMGLISAITPSDDRVDERFQKLLPPVRQDDDREALEVSSQSPVVPLSEEAVTGIQTTVNFSVESPELKALHAEITRQYEVREVTKRRRK